MGVVGGFKILLIPLKMGFTIKFKTIKQSFKPQKS
ncbi:hypothetical protein HPGAM_04715 [Helicobacter pylori Gambia94/24]|nr:hypothetical protein HPGAM_04715 [Helicobacter pylori Gambia94/24]